MYLSRYFLPTLKEEPGEAQIVSHKLMLRAGMIQQASAGIYSWLPLGFKVMKKIEQIVREEQNRIGAVEILMPTLQPSELWKESGRYDDYGQEMLRLTDRHDREMCYGPTNEELVTDIFRRHVSSYREVPLMLYHIQWKFRDEIRPRFGVMRGREFLMKDAYSFDLDFDASKKSYEFMYQAYARTFQRLGLKSIAVRADSGAIGGDLSHEFQILAETGESTLYYDAAMETVGDDFEAVQKYYAASDELHDPEKCPIPESQLKISKGIEVGHIFHFGTKYSEPMKAFVTDQNGDSVPLQMGSYGVGVSRLVGAIIEASHDENGIIWPEAVAPFDMGLLNLRVGDETCDAYCENLYQRLTEQGIDCLYDDEKTSAGVKFARMDLIGLPYQVIVGPKGIKDGKIEIKDRKTGERHHLSEDEFFNFYQQKAA